MQAQTQASNREKQFHQELADEAMKGNETVRLKLLQKEREEPKRYVAKEGGSCMMQRVR